MHGPYGVIVACFWLMAAFQVPTPEDVLEAMRGARRDFRTAEIAWSVTCNKPPRPGTEDLIPFWHFYDGVPRYFFTRSAEDEFLIEDHGDPDGVIGRRTDGTPANESLAYKRRLYLWHEGAQWQCWQDHPLAEVHRGRCDVLDVRTFGLLSTLEQAPRLEEADAFIPARATLEVRARGDELELRARDGGWSWSYVIDPQRGWNVTRATSYKDGRLHGKSRTTLKKYGNVWFPERVEFYESDFDGARTPAKVVEILEASFDQQWHSSRLQPGDMGIEVGTFIDVFEADNPFQAIGKFGWDGEKLVPEAELRARIRSGELQYGAGMQRFLQRYLARGKDLPGWERMMRMYTHAFIAKYKLNDEQKQKALAILEDCVAAARTAWARERPQIEALWQAINALDDPNLPGTVDRGEKLAEYRAKMEKLQEPLWRIYLEQLRPRLDKLPTRAQRRAAEERSTTQPVKNEGK